MAGQQSVINGRKNLPTTNSPAAKRLRAIMERVAEERFEEMIRAQMDSAIGISLEKTNRETGDIYYLDQAPNTAAAKLIIDQIVPKEVNVKHSGGIGILHLVKALEDPDTQEEHYGSE